MRHDIGHQGGELVGRQPWSPDARDVDHAVFGTGRGREHLKHKLDAVPAIIIVGQGGGAVAPIEIDIQLAHAERREGAVGVAATPKLL
jgi:hypothetical protein